MMFGPVAVAAGGYGGGLRVLLCHTNKAAGQSVAGVGVPLWACVWARGSRRVVSRRPLRVHLTEHQQEAREAIQRYQQEQQHQQDPIALQGLRNRAATAQQKPRGAGLNHVATSSSTFPAPDPDKALRNGIRHKLLSEAPQYERTLMEKVQSRKYRRDNGLFVAEGCRIIREALQNCTTPKALYFTRLRLVAALRAPTPASRLSLNDVHELSDLPLFRTPYKTLQTWSSVTTSPGILGVFNIPSSTTTTTATSLPHATTTTTTRLPLTLVLDEIREPGNLGSLLRTAAAVGVSEVLLLKGCCDPWETKVVRAGCGAHFRLTLKPRLTWDTLTCLIPQDSHIFLADVGRAEDILEEEVEGSGRLEDEEVEERSKHRQASTKKRKREDKDHIRSRQQEGLSEEEEEGTSRGSAVEAVYELDEEGNKIMVDPSFNDPQHLELYRNVRLPTLSYDNLSLGGTGEGAVLVLGGEVGVSNAAKKFVADNFGSKISVPLANGMDSLNVGVASGVILYEMQKQLHQIAVQREQERQEWQERS